MSRNKTGFTLIELLIVIVMIGVLLALSMPKLMKVGAQSSTRSGAQTIAAQLATARAAAIASGYKSRLTLAGSTITIATSDSLGTYTTLGKSISLAETGVTVTGTPASNVVFDPRGFATGITSVQRFIVDADTYGVPKDTVCVARIGLVMPKGCDL
jgi:prepilin-type N-terminal cleavage/methylation domain-containing protein